MPTSKKLIAKYQKQGLVFLGIHSGPSRADMQKVMKDTGMNWPNLYDEGRKITKAYNVGAYPSYYLIDRKGNLRIADIDDPDLEKAIAKLVKEK